VTPADHRTATFANADKAPPTRANFPHNTNPASRFDPTAAAILALVPLPNQPGANNFLRIADITDNNDRLLTRLDLHLSQNDNVFARYIYSNRKRNIPGAFGGVLDGTGTSAFGDQTIKTNGVVGGWTRIFSPTVVNELRFNWQ